MVGQVHTGEGCFAHGPMRGPQATFRDVVGMPLRIHLFQVDEHVDVVRCRPEPKIDDRMADDLDRLGQGLTSREAIHRGVGTETERDAAIPNPSMGDEWFNTDLAGGGKWEKHTGTDWKWS